MSRPSPVIHSMLPNPIRILRDAVAALALALLLPACKDSTATIPAARELHVGTITDGRLAAGEITTYDLTLTAGQRVAIYFQAMDAQLTLEVIGPGAVSLGTTGDANNPEQLERRFVSILTTDAGRHLVRISAVGSGGGGFRVLPSSVDHSPESAAAALTLGVIVSERLDHPADIDEFTFTLSPDEEAIAFLQQTDAGAQEISVLINPVVGAGPFPVSAFGAALSTADFESTTSGRFGSSAGGAYRLTVRRAFQFQNTGGYRLVVRRVDRRPETAPASLTAGDTISEAIDHVGDVDEFTLSGAPGTEYNILVGAEGAPPRRVVVSLDIPGDFVATADPGVPLLRNPTRRFVMPASGSVSVRVEDARDRNGLYRGPYRLYAHRVDRAPEGRPATISAETGPIVGAIEVPGDIDEYLLSTTAPTMFTMTLTRRVEGAVGGGVVVEVLPAAGGERIVSTYTAPYYETGLFVVGATGRFTLPAGSYRVRVDGHTSGITGFRGTYELELYPVNPAPELVPATIAIGDTVRGESIERAGDIDTFVFSGTVADTLTVVLARPAGDTLKNHGFTVRSRQTGVPVAYVNFDALYYGRGHQETGRIQLPATGEYEVAVFTGGAALAERGPYQLILERTSARPEHRSATLAVGDTVRDEPLDLPGDIDEFILRGTPGQELVVGFQWMKSGLVNVEIIDPATRQVLFTQPSAGFLQYSRRATIPPGGELMLRVLQPPTSCEYLNPCISRYSHAGAYMFFTFPVRRLPEANGPAIAIGDTISGDRIDPSGDIDEFTFDGLAGQVIDVYFQTPHGACCFGGLTLDLVDSATGVVLGTVSSVNPTPRLEDQGIGRVTLPASRRYLVRVRGTDERCGTGVYRFRVVAP